MPQVKREHYRALADYYVALPLATTGPALQLTARAAETFQVLSLKCLKMSLVSIKHVFHLQFLHDLSGQDEADRPAVPRSGQQRKYLGKAHLREALLMHEEALRVNRWIVNSAANRLIGEVVQSRRRPLLGPSPG